jgi:hypothetical protein
MQRHWYEQDNGGRDWDRTSDPHDVNVVLLKILRGNKAIQVSFITIKATDHDSFTSRKVQ